jgi:AcrR family transcriptional regulator
MPARDEQDYENRRQQIIDGALKVFARKGFEKATNKDIAEAAGIGSPGLIYHYFKDKADLLTEVVRERAPILGLIEGGEALMDREPREVLTRFAQSLMQTMENVVAVSLFKLLLGESIRQPIVANMFNTIGPGRGFAFLRHYLEVQMDKGVLRRMDTGAAVRCFVGPIVAYILTREVFVQPDAQTLDHDTMVKTMVDIFLQGALAETPDAG